MPSSGLKTFLDILRAIFFYVLYALGVVIAGLAGWLVCRFLPFEKRYFLLSRFNWFVLRLARRMLGIRYRVEGRENMPAQPCVVAVNHESAWETYMMGLLFKPQATVLKIELMQIPFFGWALKPLEPIPLDRSKPAAALKQLIRLGLPQLAAGRWLVIFPEGTRVRPGQVERLSKGAAMLAVRAGVPLLPVAHNAGDCWPAGQLVKHPGLITVVIGAPIPSTGRTAAEVHGEMELWIRSQVSELRSRNAKSP